MNDKNYYISIICNRGNTTLYIGITSNLVSRIYQHKKELVEGFSKRYKCKKLIYYETYNNVQEAIKREKQIKKWRREKKERLVNKENSKWEDLYKKII